MKRIVRIAHEMSQHSKPEDDLRHRLIGTDQRDDRLRVFLDTFAQMCPMDIHPLLGQRPIDARGILMMKTADDQAEIARRQPRSARADLLIRSSGPGVGSDWNEKEEEKSFHQQSEW